MLQNSFYEVTMFLILKPNEDITHTHTHTYTHTHTHTQLQANITDEHRCKNS